MGIIAESLKKENELANKSMDEIQGKIGLFSDMMAIVIDLAHERNPNDPDIHKKLLRYFKLVENASPYDCFVCGDRFDCIDNPRVCLSHNLEMYVCLHCAKTEIEFLTFVKSIIW